jgi:hypothetical protein
MAMTGWDGTFWLLADFWSAYDVFPLKALGMDERLETTVVEPMRAALDAHVGSLVVVSESEIQERIRAAHIDDAFVITMDGGSYFDVFDFSFEITRAVFQLADVLSQQFFRMARESKPGFHAQTLRIRAQYQDLSAARPIVLCDDGLGTGRSVSEVLRSLASLDLDVSKIVVLINPTGLEHVDGVPVHTLFPEADARSLWLSERDLYWGLPRSGVSFTRFDDVNPCFGLPYTIDTDVASSRLGLPLSTAREFRLENLSCNGRFWRLLEEHRGPLEFPECPRLAFVPEYLETRTARVAGFIESVATPDFQVMSRARMPEMGALS